MIDKVKILDANYSELERKFPDGLELETDSNVVLLVGPNNVGKTALLRMLATSLEFGRYFRSQGISYFWDYSADDEQAAKKVIEALNKAEEIENGWFAFDAKYHKKSFNRLCERRGIEYCGQVREIINGKDSEGLPKPYYYGYPGAFQVINQEGKNRIMELERLLKIDTDENIWGFVKPTISGEGEVFIQHFDLPHDRTTVREQELELRRYVHFVNKDDYYFGELKPSPGHNLYKQLDELFEKQVKQFFEERKNSLWKRRDYSMEGKFEAMFSLGKGKPMEDVPEHSRLCVIMDEPTIFLDAVNKFKFQKKMLEMTQLYPGRLQFFIASNDYALIKGMEGNCVYINMYEQPVSSLRSFDVQKYLSD